MNHIFLLSSAEARRLWECLMDPPAVHILWEDLVTLLCDLFGVERTNLFLVVPEKEQLRSRAASRFKWDIELPWNEGIAGQVYQTRKPLLTNDIPSSEFAHYFNRDPKGFKTRSMLTVPVFRDGDETQPIVLIIQLVNKLDGEFNNEDIEALRYWSRQIGVTLERTHGTEIWKHPESEPPVLDNPEFDPVFPQLARRQAALALPGFINMIVSELGTCHMQIPTISWAKNIWERSELIKMVRDGHRHARIVHKLSGEPSRTEKRLLRIHRYFLRLMRWVCGITRSSLGCHMIAAYEEWVGFHATAFAYWLCQSMPHERNLLYSMLEDRRSHCIFYESLLLDYLIHHPHRRTEFHIGYFLLRTFYSFMTRRLVQTMAHVSHRKDLPAQFFIHFRSFTEHRTQSLLERAEVRTPSTHTTMGHLSDILLGVISVVGFGLLVVLSTPIALIMPMRKLPTLPVEEPGLLEQRQAANA